LHSQAKTLCAGQANPRDEVQEANLAIVVGLCIGFCIGSSFACFSFSFIFFLKEGPGCFNVGFKGRSLRATQRLFKEGNT
jgi:hypothetical protein